MFIRHRGRKQSKAAKVIFIMLIVLIITVIFLEIRLKPVIRSVASIQAQSFATLTINETVTDILDEMNISGEELETVTASSDGTIASISTNTVVTNRLKNLITTRTQEALSNIQSKRIDVPIGTILGGELFNGVGPAIPVYISMSGTVNSDFEEEFESGGINQTVHKLSVKISAEINIIMPMTSCTERVETTVLVGETVIVGETPDGLLMHEQTIS